MRTTSTIVKSTVLPLGGPRAAVHTIYGSFGSKIAVLKELLDTTHRGDDGNVRLLDRSGPQAMREETDQRQKLTVFATGIEAQLERLRPIDDILRSAAAVDAEAAALREDIQVCQRREAMRTITGWISARDPLKEWLSEDDAAAGRRPVDAHVARGALDAGDTVGPVVPALRPLVGRDAHRHAVGPLGALARACKVKSGA